MIREKLEILMLLSAETTESSLIQMEKNFVKGIPIPPQGRTACSSGREEKTEAPLSGGDAGAVLRGGAVEQAQELAGVPGDTA
jgi:hypothetical protein